MQVSRGGSFVAGVLVALVVGGGTAVASGGVSITLGKANVAKTTTSVTNTKGTPLSLTAKNGSSPLKVSNTVEVKNLNAALLAGKSASDFLATGGTAANSSLLGGQPASAFLGAGGTAVNATQLGGQPATAYLPAAGTAADSAKLGGQPAASYVGAVYSNQTDAGAVGGIDPGTYTQQVFDAVNVPSGSYDVAFTGELANGSSTGGQFGCQLRFTTTGPPIIGFSDAVNINGAQAVTYGTAAINQVIVLPTTGTIDVQCYDIAGDPSHNSDVEFSTLTATRIQDLHGTSYTVGTPPYGIVH